MLLFQQIDNGSIGFGTRRNMLSSREHNCGRRHPSARPGFRETGSPAKASAPEWGTEHETREQLTQQLEKENKARMLEKDPWHSKQFAPPHLAVDLHGRGGRFSAGRVADPPLSVSDIRLPVPPDVTGWGDWMPKSAERARSARGRNDASQCFSQRRGKEKSMIFGHEPVAAWGGNPLPNASFEAWVDTAKMSLYHGGVQPQSNFQPGKVETAADIKRRRGPPLQRKMRQKVRARIKGAAYVGVGGRNLETLFQQLDKDHSGQLEDAEVKSALRRVLKIPPSSISDQQIGSLCALLDADNSGNVSVEELVSFIEADPVDSRHA